MSAAGTTSTLCTVSPLICMPRIAVACAFASAASLPSLTPPALPRPPVWTCALTTTVPPSRLAIASTSAGVAATSPSGVGTPAALMSARAWYSWRFTSVPRDGGPRQPGQRRGSFGQRGDHRASAAFPDELRRRFDLGSDAPLLQLPAGEHPFGLGEGHLRDLLLGREPPVAIHGIDAGQDQQDLGPEVAGKDGADPVLVHHRVEPLE